MCILPTHDIHTHEITCSSVNLLLSRQTICQYGMWDQLRVDQGKEWYLMLYMQEYLTEHRRNPHASPYLQTTSTQVRFHGVISILP